ncbi:hypothetical protein GCM10010452_41520 [Crossiella cryophila]
MVAVSARWADKPDARFPSERRYLLCSPETGLVLAVDDVALAVNTESTGVAVPTPSTVGYELWDDTAYVRDSQSRP